MSDLRMLRRDDRGPRLAQPARRCCGCYFEAACARSLRITFPPFITNLHPLQAR